jgi:hypothetical protein
MVFFWYRHWRIEDSKETNEFEAVAFTLVVIVIKLLIGDSERRDHGQRIQ